VATTTGVPLSVALRVLSKTLLLALKPATVTSAGVMLAVSAAVTSW
jgi:hypothetical protein